MSTDKKFMFRWAPKLMAAAFILLFVVAVIYFLKDIIFADDSHKKQVIHEISLIKPPPPPPPKPEEKPPEPEVKKEEVKIPEPETPPPPDQPENAKQDEPPPANNLGLDADGQAGSDSFGLGANKGGRSIIGGGNGGGGNRYGWYAGMIEKGIQDVFDRNKDLLSKDSYKVVIKVWVNKDGSIERFDLGGSSGNPETDKAIRTALKEITRVKEPPPDGMPQPVKLRITSRLL